MEALSGRGRRVILWERASSFARNKPYLLSSGRGIVGGHVWVFVALSHPIFPTCPPAIHHSFPFTVTEEQKDQRNNDDKLQSNQFNLLTVWCFSFVGRSW
jgi:hypothetical protein